MGAFVALENISSGQETVKMWPSKVEGVIEKKNTMTNYPPTLVCKQLFPYQQTKKNLTHVQHPFY
jgi:hypothetical protein